MQAVLDAPVASPETQKTVRRRATNVQARDRIRSVMGRFFADGYGTVYAADLTDGRPVQIAVETFRGVQTASFDPIGVFVAGLRLSDLIRPFDLFRGGKTVRRTRRKQPLSTSPGCL